MEEGALTKMQVIMTAVIRLPVRSRFSRRREKKRVGEGGANLSEPRTNRGGANNRNERERGNVWKK